MQIAKPTQTISYPDRWRLADCLARQLLDQLNAGAFPRLGMDQIEAALDAAWIGPPDAETRDDMLGLICRCVVERATTALTGTAPRPSA